jgi:hypothetical protein
MAYGQMIFNGIGTENIEGAVFSAILSPVKWFYSVYYRR